MKFRDPLISVVIPVHNKEPHVQRSISSVLSQIFEDFELIIIDDASTDGSYEEIKKFNDDRIRVFRRDTPGPGGYAARNLGIKKARGEWTAFLDADDSWEPYFLEELNILIKRFPEAGLLCTAYKIVYPDCSSLDSYSKKNQTKERHEFNIANFLNGPRPPCTSATAVKTKILHKVDGFDVRWKHGADTDLWLRILLTGIKGAWSPKFGATYYKDSVNMVTDNRTQEMSPCSETIKKYLKENSNISHKNSLKKFSNKHYRKPFVRRANNGGFNTLDVIQKFYLSQPSKTLLIFLFASLLPHRLQKKILNKYV